MKKAKLVKVYAVMLVTGENMKEVFRSTDKNLCKEYKKENAKKGKLGIMYVDNIWQPAQYGKEKTRYYAS